MLNVVGVVLVVLAVLMYNFTPSEHPVLITATIDAIQGDKVAFVLLFNWWSKEASFILKVYQEKFMSCMSNQHAWSRALLNRTMPISRFLLTQQNPSLA
jgi:hypothetical protein